MDEKKFLPLRLFFSLCKAVIFKCFLKITVMEA